MAADYHLIRAKGYQIGNLKRSSFRRDAETSTETGALPGQKKIQNFKVLLEFAAGTGASTPTGHAASARADPIANQCDRRVCFGKCAGPDRNTCCIPAAINRVASTPAVPALRTKRIESSRSI